MTERVTAADLLIDEDDVQEIEDSMGEVCAFTSIGNLETDLGAENCSHVFRVGDRRLLGLEPHPGSGYWKTCPRCGMYVGQERFAGIDLDISATSVTSLRI